MPASISVSFPGPPALLSTSLSASFCSLMLCWSAGVARYLSGSSEVGGALILTAAAAVAGREEVGGLVDGGRELVGGAAERDGRKAAPDVTGRTAEGIKRNN